MDAGIALINKGLTMDWDWDNPTKVECWPKYVRHIDWEPCDCPDDDSKQLRCFFCRNGFTHGIAHKDENRKRNKPSTARETCSDRVDRGHSGFCYLCIEEVKRENPGIKVKDARKLLLEDKSKKNFSGRLGYTTCNKHVCARHWEDHGVD